MLAVTQDEIETLYSRFRILDRSSKVCLYGSCVGNLITRQSHFVARNRTGCLWHSH